jgi:hypothetical protein
MLVLIAHDLIAWTHRLLLTGELARCEPKRALPAAAHRLRASPLTPAKQPDFRSW